MRSVLAYAADFLFEIAIAGELVILAVLKSRTYNEHAQLKMELQQREHELQRMLDEEQAVLKIVDGV